MVSADTVRQHIVDHLKWDASLKGADIKVDYVGRIAILSGTVPNLVAHSMAQRDALSIPGVERVENRLQVKQSHDHPTVSDKEVESNVKAVLICSLDSGGKQIDVSAEDGVVTLTGSADSYWKKARLIDLAGSVDGVLEIKDKVTVKPAEKAPDGAIKKEITDALGRMEVAGLEKVLVAVQDGKVALSGSVPTWSTAFDVEDTARHTSGVTAVVSNLTVE